MRPATEADVLPRPRRVRRHAGILRVDGGVRVVGGRGGTNLVCDVARWLTEAAGVDVARRACSAPAVTVERTDVPDRPQSYSLGIRPDGVLLRAGDGAGLRYGALTLGQLLAAGKPAVAAMDIDDAPEFPARGVMLDISRDKVPTLATLRRLIDRLAGWKINHLQLYTEHTFAYAGHERVWRGASPLTGPQIESLDRYCRERFIVLVPNQNSFGHMERWLKRREYADLAEAPDGFTTPWGEFRRTPATLNPLDRRSIRLVESLYGQLLPHFSSRLFNVGCDETFELGQGRSRAACKRRGRGRVYLDFLLKLHRLVRRHGRRMMFWSDIIHEHPELIDDLPDDVVPLVWEYEADRPFGPRCRELARRGLSFYVCPGTSSWCSFGGRTRNALGNLLAAATEGRRHGATGYFITDWGDYGHRQYLPASYCGLLYGAAVSWSARANAGIDVAREVGRRIFGDPTGAAGESWFDVGTVHEASDISLRNRTVLFSIMQSRLEDVPALPGITKRSIAALARRIDRIESSAATARFNGDEGTLAHQELLATLAVLRHACRRAEAARSGPHDKTTRRALRWLAADIRRIIARHRRLWLARNRPGGLKDSTSHYHRILREYERQP